MVLCVAPLSVAALIAIEPVFVVDAPAPTAVEPKPEAVVVLPNAVALRPEEAELKPTAVAKALVARELLVSFPAPPIATELAAVACALEPWAIA